MQNEFIQRVTVFLLKAVKAVWAGNTERLLACTVYLRCRKLLSSKRCAVLFFYLLIQCSFSAHVCAQLPQTYEAEQQLESLTETNSDTETEDDAYQQQMQYYQQHPLNLNTATEEELKELKMLSPVQMQNFLSYRSLLGRLLSYYELQAVPGWSVELIIKLRPFTAVNNDENITAIVKKRFRSGEHSLLVRISQAVEKAKGYYPGTAGNAYSGSPQKLLVRYKYQFKNLLQYGMLGEKDEGEQFFKGGQKQGFDFYSAHFFVRNAGSIKSLAVGDFAVNIGQGLIQWQSLAFKKGADVIAIKREAETIKPYTGAGEIFFHRGAAVTVQKRKLQFTGFVSYRKMDANLVANSLTGTADSVSSFQTTGYHRTKLETTDKGAQRQFAFGGTLRYNFHGLRLGVNMVQYKFNLPFQKGDGLHNLYDFSGSRLSNYSIDYSYTFKNCHFFGEAATNRLLHTAFVSGMLVSASPVVDMSFLYRNISPGYQSLYSNAFTENASPTNEKGFYAGIAVHPGGAWQFSAYADFFKFPWLRFSTDAPSQGTSFMAQLNYRPGRQLEILTRYSTTAKLANNNMPVFILPEVVPAVRKSLRTQLAFSLNTEVNIRSRAEIVWFLTGNQQEQGFLGYTEVAYKPAFKKWQVSTRLQFFETESYNSRIYAYETDVLYSTSVPVFYNNGLRYFLLGSYDINKKTTIWLRWSQTIYRDKTITGSGLDAVEGNKKSAFKLQLRYFF